MERTQTINPIEYTSWDAAAGRGFHLLPISNYHTLMDMEEAKRWLNDNFSVYKISFDWQYKANPNGYKPTSVMIRTQSTKTNEISVRKEFKWVEILIDNIRIVFDKTGKIDADVVIEHENEIIHTTPAALFAGILSEIK